MIVGVPEIKKNDFEVEISYIGFDHVNSGFAPKNL